MRGTNRPFSAPTPQRLYVSRVVLRLRHGYRSVTRRRVVAPEIVSHLTPAADTLPGGLVEALTEETLTVEPPGPATGRDQDGGPAHCVRTRAQGPKCDF